MVGLTARPTGLRIPVAYTCSSVPSGLNWKMRAPPLLDLDLVRVVHHIRVRADRDEHLRAVFGEDHVTSPVPAAAQPARRPTDR